MTGDRHRDRQAGRADPGRERVKPRQARGRLNRIDELVGVAACRAQHVEDGAQLAQAVLARRADRLQGFGRLLGAVAEQGRGRAGLHGDRGHRVRHHVMQFPGDAHPLLVDPPLCLLGGLPGQLRALGVKVGASAAERQPGEERDREVGRDEEEAATGLPEGIIGRRGCHQRGGNGDRPRARAQRRRRRIGGKRAHRDGGQQQCHAVLVAGQGVGDHDGRRRAEHEPRVTVPPGEDDAARSDEQQRGVRRVRQMVLSGEVGAGR
jgi:hypothetical protein